MLWARHLHYNKIPAQVFDENVTECTGGARGLTDGDLARAYKSTVDPRLNYEQAMEVAMRIAGLHHAEPRRDRSQ